MGDLLEQVPFVLIADVLEKHGGQLVLEYGRTNPDCLIYEILSQKLDSLEYVTEYATASDLAKLKQDSNVSFCEIVLIGLCKGEFKIQYLLNNPLRKQKMGPKIGVMPKRKHIAKDFGEPLIKKTFAQMKKQKLSKTKVPDDLKKSETISKKTAGVRSAVINKKEAKASLPRLKEGKQLAPQSKSNKKIFLISDEEEDQQQKNQQQSQMKEESEGFLQQQEGEGEGEMEQKQKIEEDADVNKDKKEEEKANEVIVSDDEYEMFEKMLQKSKMKTQNINHKQIGQNGREQAKPMMNLNDMKNKSNSNTHQKKQKKMAPPQPKPPANTKNLLNYFTRKA